MAVAHEQLRGLVMAGVWRQACCRIALTAGIGCTLDARLQPVLLGGCRAAKGSPSVQTTPSLAYRQCRLAGRDPRLRASGGVELQHLHVRSNRPAFRSPGPLLEARLGLD